MASGGALFGTVSAGPGSTGGRKHLVEMKAGKMYLKDRKVFPDKRKGLLYLYKGEDSLMHFCWKDRTSGTVEDDLIIFPDECEYVKVAECTTGRVYLLRFKSSKKKFFFWLQESKVDKDDVHCERINELLNRPLSSSSSQSSDNQVHDLQSLFRNMSESQLTQMFGRPEVASGLSNLFDTLGASSSRRSGATSRTAVSGGSTLTSAGSTSANGSSTDNSAPITINTSKVSTNLQDILQSSQKPSEEKPGAAETSNEDPVGIADFLEKSKESDSASNSGTGNKEKDKQLKKGKKEEQGDDDEDMQCD